MCSCNRLFSEGIEAYRDAWRYDLFPAFRELGKSCVIAVFVLRTVNHLQHSQKTPGVFDIPIGGLHVKLAVCYKDNPVLAVAARCTHVPRAGPPTTCSRISRTTTIGSLMVWPKTNVNDPGRPTCTYSSACWCTARLTLPRRPALRQRSRKGCPR